MARLTKKQKEARAKVDKNKIKGRKNYFAGMLIKQVK